MPPARRAASIFSASENYLFLIPCAAKAAAGDCASQYFSQHLAAAVQAAFLLLFRFVYVKFTKTVSRERYCVKKRRDAASYTTSSHIHNSSFEKNHADLYKYKFQFRFILSCVFARSAQIFFRSVVKKKNYLVEIFTHTLSDQNSERAALLFVYLGFLTRKKN